MTSGAEAPRETQRLDKWLVYARLCKTRSQAVAMVSSGIRVNGRRIEKPDAKLHAGDVLTLVVGFDVRLIRILLLANKRVSPQAAGELYAFLPQVASTLE